MPVFLPSDGTICIRVHLISYGVMHQIYRFRFCTQRSIDTLCVAFGTEEALLVSFQSKAQTWCVQASLRRPCFRGLCSTPISRHHLYSSITCLISCPCRLACFLAPGTQRGPTRGEWVSDPCGPRPAEVRRRTRPHFLVSSGLNCW